MATSSLPPVGVKSKIKIKMIDDRQLKLRKRLEAAHRDLCIIDADSLISAEVDGPHFNAAYNSLWSENGPGVVIIRNTLSPDDTDTLLQRTAETMSSFYADSEHWPLVEPIFIDHYNSGRYEQALSTLELLRTGKTCGSSAFGYKRKPPTMDEAERLYAQVPEVSQPVEFTYAPSYSLVKEHLLAQNEQLFSKINHLCQSPGRLESGHPVEMMKPYDNVKVAYNAGKTQARALGVPEDTINKLPKQTKNVPTKFHTDTYEIERYQGMLCLKQGKCRFTVVPGMYTNDNEQIGFVATASAGSTAYCEQRRLIWEFGVAVGDGDIILWQQGIVHGDAYYHQDQPDEHGLFTQPDLYSKKSYPSGELYVRMLVGPVPINYPEQTHNFLQHMADRGFIPESFKGRNKNVEHISINIINSFSTRYVTDYKPSDQQRQQFIDAATSY